MKITNSILAIVVALCWVNQVQSQEMDGTRYYVSTSGDDTNEGSAQAPFATVERALDLSSAGDIVHISSGQYELSRYSKVVDYPLTIIGENRNNTVINQLGLLTIKNSFTVKNLRFTGNASHLFALLVEANNSLNGFRAENCIFEGAAQAIVTSSENSGEITNVIIRNNDFINLYAGKVRPIGIVTGTSSNISIKNNNFVNLVSTSKLSIGIHLIGRKIDVSGNYFENIKGPDGVEVHAAIAYGEDINISHNSVVNFQPGVDHEALYMKANNSLMSNNVLLDSTSNQGAIAVKSSGPYSHKNVIKNNRIKSSNGGIGIYSAGATEPVYSNNFVKLDNSQLSSIGLYIYDTLSTSATIKDNYAEASHIGSYISGSKDSPIEDNTLISYRFSYPDSTKSRPLYIAGWNTNVIDQNNIKLSFDGPPPNSPKAVIKADTVQGESPLVVRFDGKESSDPHGRALAYQWDFHDETTSLAQSVEHTFYEPRTYAVTLIVTNQDGLKDMAVLIIRVDSSNPPKAPTNLRQANS